MLTSCAETDTCSQGDGKQHGGRGTGEHLIGYGQIGDVSRHFGDIVCLFPARKRVSTDIVRVECVVLIYNSLSEKVMT